MISFANSLFHFCKECVMIFLSNAMKRNSISEPDCRKLLGDAKQQTEQRELALEQLLEILRESRCRRKPTVTGEEHTISGMIDWPDRRAGQWGMEHSVSVLTECMRLIMN